MQNLNIKSSLFLFTNMQTISPRLKLNIFLGLREKTTEKIIVLMRVSHSEHFHYKQRFRDSSLGIQRSFCTLIIFDKRQIMFVRLEQIFFLGIPSLVSFVSCRCLDLNREKERKRERANARGMSHLLDARVGLSFPTQGEHTKGGSEYPSRAP